MSLSCASLAADYIASPGTGYNTASVTLASGKVSVLWVFTADSGCAAPTCSGWTQFVTYDDGVLGRITGFTRLGAGATGVHAVSFGAETPDKSNYLIEEWTDSDAGGTNGGATIVQTQTGRGTGTALVAAALAAFGDATNNAAYAVAASDYAVPFTKEDANYTIVSTTSGYQEFDSEYRVGQDTTPNFSNGSGNWMMVSVEIKKAGAAAGTVIPVLRNLYRQTRD